ncbi:MAG: hypothetical protein R3C14_20375 [Caldilineaceae bacterium]
MNTQQKLEWHFSKDEDDTSDQWDVLSHKVTGDATHTPRPTLLYELLLGIALLYGIALYLIWQQAAQRMAVLEEEVTTLQQEIASLPAAEGAPFKSGVSDHYPFETDYLRFETSVRTAAVVQAIAQPIDATYQQFYRDFGVPLPAATDKLNIVVDTAVNLTDPIMDDNILIVPLPYAAAEQFDLTLADALTNELMIRLSQRVLDKALQGRNIKPQWRAMTLALKTYLQLNYGYNKAWQLEPVFLHNRHQGQTRLLALVQSTPYIYMTYDPADSSPYIKPAVVATADPLIEYIVKRYGYTTVPNLLSAFEVYESWEPLAPAVFGISAAELEEQWHTYLRTTYPLAND